MGKGIVLQERASHKLKEAISDLTIDAADEVIKQLQEENTRLRKALEWYKKTVADACIIIRRDDTEILEGLEDWNTACTAIENLREDKGQRASAALDGKEDG